MVWVLQWLELDILLLLIVNKLIGESYLAGQFRKIKRSLAEQWRFNRKKHVKGGDLLGLVWYCLTLQTCRKLAGHDEDEIVSPKKKDEEIQKR